MPPLGTILPTADTLAAGDAAAARLNREKIKAAARAGLSSPYNVGGETRYKTGTDTYAIIGSRLQVLHFRTTAKGDFSIAKP